MAEIIAQAAAVRGKAKKLYEDACSRAGKQPEALFNMSGAANDLERSTQTARQMVTELGMSERLGLVKLGNKHEEIFLGRDISEERNYSEEIAYAIDQKVKAIIDSCYDKARAILKEHRDLMDRIAGILLEREVLDRSEFDR